AGALGRAGPTDFASIAPALSKAVVEAGHQFDSWQQQLEESDWLTPGAPYYFLARGTSLSSCNEARLLWEEGVKTPATAMDASSFRHGPQEIARPGMRFCLWIDQSIMREEDLAVAADLEQLGASVMLIGENLPPNAAQLLLQLSSSPPYWQFAIDIFPIQLAAERLARLAG